MTPMPPAIRFAIAGAFALAALAAYAQAPLTDEADRSIVRGASVQYLYPEQVTTPAGKPTAVEMHFRVANGLHINSHTPTEDYLIPTTLFIPQASGVRLQNATYPEGTDITLPVDPNTRLNVYTGEFTILARIVADRGNHLVVAKLHFQACDNNACMPPKSITVPIDVIGK
jgi:hypothetical protein